jgi:hypothetical protein
VVAASWALARRWTSGLKCGACEDGEPAPRVKD